jgi:hypothetical protein
MSGTEGSADVRGPPLFLDSECRGLGSENAGCVGMSKTPGDNIAAFNASAAPVAILNTSRTVPVVHGV